MTRPIFPTHQRRLRRLGRTVGLGALALIAGLAALTVSPSAVPRAQRAASDRSVSVEWAQPDASPRVVVTLPRGSGRAAAQRAADEWGDPNGAGLLTVRYDGGQIQRTGVRADRLPPAPPPPPPPSRRNASAPPPAPPRPPSPPTSARGVVRVAGVDMSGLANGPQIQALIDALPARLAEDGAPFGHARVAYTLTADEQTLDLRATGDVAL